MNIRKKFNEQRIAAATAKSPLGAPQFMGMQNVGKGSNSIEEVRKYIKNQRRNKGYALTIPTGTSQFNLDLSGSARVWLGFIISIPQAPPANPVLFPQAVSFTLNNEIIIDSVHTQLFTNYANDSEYFEQNRPLSGKDDITFSFQNSNPPVTIYLNVYYI
jgi:hypothetical protein